MRSGRRGRISLPAVPIGKGRSDCGHPSCRRSPRHHDLFAGGRGLAPGCGTVCLCDVCARYHRHRLARQARAGRLDNLCVDRDGGTYGEIRCQATIGTALLRNDFRDHMGRCLSQRLHQLRAGAVLGRRLLWHSDRAFDDRSASWLAPRRDPQPYRIRARPGCQSTVAGAGGLFKCGQSFERRPLLDREAASRATYGSEYSASRPSGEREAEGIREAAHVELRDEVGAVHLDRPR